MSTMDVKWDDNFSSWKIDAPFRQTNDRADTKQQAIEIAKNKARPGDEILIFKKSDGKLDRTLEVDEDVYSNSPIDESAFGF